MKSSYSPCYGTGLETEHPPLKTMSAEHRQSSDMGKILLEGLDALAATDTTPDPIGVASDRAISTGIKKGQSRRGPEPVAYSYTPSAEVRLKFARLGTDLINAMEQATEREG